MPPILDSEAAATTFFDGLTKDINEAVLFIVVYPSEVVYGCCAAAVFWEDEKGGVEYNLEDHVSGVVADCCIWVGVEIVHQHVTFF